MYIISFFLKRTHIQFSYQSLAKDSEQATNKKCLHLSHSFPHSHSHSTILYEFYASGNCLVLLYTPQLLYTYTCEGIWWNEIRKIERVRELNIWGRHDTFFWSSFRRHIIFSELSAQFILNCIGSLTKFKHYKNHCNVVIHTRAKATK